MPERPTSDGEPSGSPRRVITFLRRASIATVAGVLTACAAGPQAAAPSASPRVDPTAATAPMRYNRSWGGPARVGGSEGVRKLELSRDADRPPLKRPKPKPKQYPPDQVQRRQGAHRAKPEAAGDPREIARVMLAEYGWTDTEFSCLDSLWISESDWDTYAENPTSGAYGIPQSLPAEKMASAGADWRTNPATQIAWGLDYIRLSYGTPCSANAFKISYGWY